MHYRSIWKIGSAHTICESKPKTGTSMSCVSLRAPSASSICSVGFHPDYGIADASLSVHKIGPMTEVPMSVADVFGRRIPCSGGGYFRLLPYRATRFLIRQCNRQGRPVIFYLHPWEVDP